MKSNLRFSIMALLILMALVAVGSFLVLLPLKALRSAQEEAIAARLAAEERALAAIAAAKEQELAFREERDRVSATAAKLQQQGSASPTPTPSDLKLLAWNIESDGNDPATIAGQLTELGPYDLIALQEVKPENMPLYEETFRQTHGDRFRAYGASTGNADRLMLLFDAERLQPIDMRELFEQDGIVVNPGKYRSPLIAHFRDQRDGTEFLVLTVHLARGDAEFRQQQAEGLRRWADAQRLPILALGDFNMDYDFRTEQGNAAFDQFLMDGIWQWVRPETLVDTNWYDGDQDGQDDYPGSMLDFVFTAGGDWQVTCKTLVRDGDFPDDEATSDHRPIEVIVGPTRSADDTTR
ncbi:MAG: endonuclease/exonuclease/phosphatase family protein [Planctomycetota bacterium]